MTDQNSAIGRPMEILLVEDNLVQANLTIGALKHGYIAHRLTYVRDGVEAIEFLRQQGRFVRAPRPDLILLDLRLPKKDGLEVLGEIKEIEHLKLVPVVVLTASDDQDDRARCEYFDVAGYITKPLDLPKFLLLVERLKRFWRNDVILPAHA